MIPGIWNFYSKKFKRNLNVEKIKNLLTNLQNFDTITLEIRERKPLKTRKETKNYDDEGTVELCC